MASKSWPMANSSRRRSSTRQLGFYSDPVIYIANDSTSFRSKTSKRNSEESLERENKRIRTSSSPCCSQTLRRPSTSDTAATLVSVQTVPPDTTETQQIRRSGEKEKSSSDEKKERQRNNSGSSSTEDAGTSTPTTPSLSTGAEGRNSTKRKSDEAQEPRKRSRKTCRRSESDSPHVTAEASTSEKPSTSSTSLPVQAPKPGSRAAFEAKYKQEKLLGEGGYGSVYAGHRRDDGLPVAIKHVPQIDIRRTFILLDGRITWVPVEVAMLLKLRPRAAAETSAAVTLLDWYDVDYELILVLERPVPCMDLIDYISSKGSSLQEYDAKIIMKQLVDGIIEVHSRGVFHRDIKLDNILIETGSDVPRVRLIDFGCGTYLSEGRYSAQQGTYLYISPECFLCGWYTAEPTTVWQLGVVLYGMLHENLPFKDSSEIVYGNPKVSENLSDDCQGFLLSCLVKSPEARPSLETLKHHPWLM